jgi:hypothetical protein
MSTFTAIVLFVAATINFVSTAEEVWYFSEFKWKTALPPDVPSNVTHFYFRGNWLFDSFEQYALANLSDLVYVNITTNYFKMIPSQLFLNSPIEVLDIGSNEISEIPDLEYISGTLKNLQVNHALLSNTTLSNVSKLVNLEQLGIGHNVLYTLFADPFRTLTSLRRLDIWDCRLTAVEDLSFLRPALETIYLLGNKLKCDYNVCWMVNFNYTLFNGKCLTPSNYSGMTLDEVLPILCPISRY